MRKIKETPWIRYDNQHLFDLETEKFSSPEQFLDYLNDILRGEVEVDKYGNTIKLRSREDKINFVQALQHDQHFQAFLKYSCTENEKELLRFIMEI